MNSRYIFIIGIFISLIIFFYGFSNDKIEYGYISVSVLVTSAIISLVKNQLYERNIPINDEAVRYD
jgi:hypothetical protein